MSDVVETTAPAPAASPLASLESFIATHAASFAALGSVLMSVLDNLPLDPANKAALQTTVATAKDAVSDAAQAVTDGTRGEVVQTIESTGTAIVEGAEAVEEGLQTAPAISANAVAEAVKTEVLGAIPNIITAVLAKL